MNHNDEIKRLFKLYLEGKTNTRQEETLFRYLNNSKNSEKEFDALMREVWRKEPAPHDDSKLADEGLDKIWARLEQKKKKKYQRYDLFKYAASLVMVVSAALGWYVYHMQVPDTSKNAQLISKTTGRGEKIKMILPDSSVIYLGSMSKLTWPAHFIKGSKRIISLEGEAFFNVKRDTSSPFIVQTANLRTQVLGTSFNIYAYKADDIFSVTVRTGKVSVSEHTDGKLKQLSLLTPGMRLVYHNNNSSYAVSSNVRIEDVSSWTTNRFIFHNESLATILSKLERYYNVHFNMTTNRFYDCRFNATFANKSIKEVMEQLRIMTGSNLHYRINSDNTIITLWGEGCQ